jgi:xanthine dehydrogenase accessory factor
VSTPTSTIDDPVIAALTWLGEGHGAALATVTRTWGSAPRQAGSQMAIRDDGAFVGSVSGGCVEGAVIAEAQGALADGRARNLQYGVTNEDAWAVGLACGGEIGVHLAPVGPTARDVLAEVMRARAEHRAAVVATPLAGGESRVIDPDAGGTDALADAARTAARRDTSGAVEVDGAEWFLTVFNPPLDLVVIGAVHVAQPLVQIARMAGYEVRVMDPRAAFATAERFPDTKLIHQWADEALADAPLSTRSAVVALAHDPKLDDPALIVALRSPAFYVGALGSKKTHARRLGRLTQQGFTPEDLARIRGPIGLSIGARSPAEIAVSIMAEMTQVLRGS